MRRYIKFDTPRIPEASTHYVPPAVRIDRGVMLKNAEVQRKLGRGTRRDTEGRTHSCNDDWRKPNRIYRRIKRHENHGVRMLSGVRINLIWNHWGSLTAL